MFAKIISFLFLVNTISYGCDANCVSCHPKLVKNERIDSNHRILKNCIRCHTKRPDAENHKSCGTDCWSCHKIENVKPKNIKEHLVLKKCIECHLTLDKSLLKIHNTQPSTFMSPKL